jgi:hypothetical protein
MPDLSTCGELADYLVTQPRDRKIVLQKDAEGNGYSPLADASEEMYLAECTWAGEIFPVPESPAGQSAEYDHAPDDAERVVVLGPVN